MWARVTRFVEPPDRTQEDIDETRAVVIELAQRAAGFRGIYYLVNRTSGEGLALTLWEDEQALRSSEDETRRIREELASRFAADILTVQNLEVALQPEDVLTVTR